MKQRRLVRSWTTAPPPALVRRSDDQHDSGTNPTTNNTPRTPPDHAVSPPEPANPGPDADPRIAQLRADKNTYVREYTGRDKAALRAELRTLAATDPRRQRYDALKARYAAFRYWQKHGALRPPERDAAHPVNEHRAALRRQLAALPAPQLHELYKEFRRRYGDGGGYNHAQRWRALEALPLEHAERQRFERLYAAKKLAEARRGAERRDVIRQRYLRNEFERRYLFAGKEALRAQLERGEGGAREQQRYQRLKRAYDEWEAAARRSERDGSAQARAEASRQRRHVPHRPLPADIPAAMERLKPGAAEYRRLKLFSEQRLAEYLAADDAQGSRLKRYNELKTDYLEYRRLAEWRKKGYVGPDAPVAAPVESSGDDADTESEGDTQRAVGDDATVEPSATPLLASGTTEPRGELERDGEHIKPSDSRMHHIMPESARDVRQSVAAWWHGVPVRFSAAAERVKAVGEDVRRYAPAFLTPSLSSFMRSQHRTPKPSLVTH